MTVSPEVLLFACYAAFLLLAAAALDRLARHSHARSDRYRTAGFRYHPEHDAWVCPAGPDALARRVRRGAAT